MSGLIYQGHIPGTPCAWARPRANGKQFFVDGQTGGYKRLVADYVRLTYRGEPVQGPLTVQMTFSLPRPATSKLTHPTCRNDIDNLCKSVCDALNGIVWRDDGQIVYLIAGKGWALGSDPGVSITVRALEGVV